MVTVRMFSIDEKFHLRLSDGGGDPDTNVDGNHVHEGEPCSGHVLVDHYLHTTSNTILHAMLLYSMCVELGCYYVVVVWKEGNTAYTLHCIRTY